MCNTHCSELGDKAALAKKEDIVFGGIVTAVKSKFTKTGKPCGFVTLEDFEGSGELALFGEDWGQWRGMLEEGCIIYATAKCAPRYANSNYLDFRLSNVEFMQTVKENRIEKLTINMDSEIVDETLVNDLNTMMQDDLAGKTQLFFCIHDAESNTNITLRSLDKTVNVGKNLIHYIDSHPKMSYKVN